MKLRITIDVFSGRENPMIELTGKQAQEAIDRLRPTSKLQRGEMGLPPLPTWGIADSLLSKLMSQ